MQSNEEQTNTNKPRPGLRRERTLDDWDCIIKGMEDKEDSKSGVSISGDQEQMMQMIHNSYSAAEYAVENAESLALPSDSVARHSLAEEPTKKVGEEA